MIAIVLILLSSIFKFIINYILEFNYVANFYKEEHYCYFEIYFKPDNNFESANDYYVDYLYNNSNGILECRVRSFPPSHLDCFSDKPCDNKELIKLTNNNTKNSNVIWKNPIPENLTFYLSKHYYFARFDNPSFDPINKKWSFDMDIGEKSSKCNPSKIRIDLIYNGENSTATCLYNCDTKFICVPDEENQRETDIFDISPKKDKGTIDFYNIDKIELVILVQAKLKYEIAYDLYFSTDYVEFKIKVSESNLTIGRSTRIYLKSDNSNYKAFCKMNNTNILNCKISRYTEENDDSSYHNLCIINKLENAYVQWSNFNEEMPVYLSSNFSYIEAYGYFRENKWKLYVKVNELIMKYYENYLLLDIYVNNQSTTALCNHHYPVLICEYKYDYQRRNDIIKIRGETTPYLGTISFSEDLNEDQKLIKPANFSIYFRDIYSKLYSNNTLYFRIYYNYLNGLKNKYNILTEIEIIIFRENDEEIISKVSCENIDYSTKLQCYPEIKIYPCEEIKIYVNSLGYSGSVRIYPNNNTNIFIDTSDGYHECPPPKHVDIIPTDNLTTDSIESTKPNPNNIFPKDDFDDELEQPSLDESFFISFNFIILIIMIVFLN